MKSGDKFIGYFLLHCVLLFILPIIGNLILFLIQAKLDGDDKNAKAKQEQTELLQQLIKEGRVNE